jgi:ferrochelatase
VTDAAAAARSIAWRHGRAQRTAVLVVNLGTPDEPTVPAVRRYLAQFLGDPRVVEIPPLAWKPILHGVILRTRPAKSAAKYASIWTPEGSPLAVWTRKQAVLLKGYLGERGQPVLVEHAMRYGNPSIASALDALTAEGATRILVLPMYPQYSAATTATVNDEVMRWAITQRWQPELRFVGAHHDDTGYLDALADRIQAHWQTHGRAERLVLSFHGMPARTLDLGDPYFCQCQKTARLLHMRLSLKEAEVLVTFQSRFGKAKWLEPYTEPTLVQLAQQGVGSVDVFCPGFVADCLETLEEIDMEARAAFLGAGGKTFHYVSALNDRHAWIAALAALAMRHMQGWDVALPTPAALEAQSTRAKALGARA